MSERYIVWTVERGPESHSDDGSQEVRMVEIEALDEPVTVLSRTATDGIRDLHLVGSELWYLECDPCRLERLVLWDLRTPDEAIPAVTDGRFAITDGVIVWPGSEERGECLTIYSRVTKSTTQTMACGLWGPSLGDRFVTWTPGGDDDRFVLYDLEDGTLQRIGDYRFDGRDEVVSSPSLEGDLLAFQYWPEGMDTDAPTELRWARLPGRGQP